MTDDYDLTPRTMIAYDGELLYAQDALARYERDDELQEKYEAAEAALDDEQQTWSDVVKTLEQSLYK